MGQVPSDSGQPPPGARTPSGDEDPDATEALRADGEVVMAAVQQDGLRWSMRQRRCVPTEG